MKYIALLRGINVGGNSLIKMADLKDAVTKIGFRNVITYIQSGNIIFESDEKDAARIAALLEDNLSKNFKIRMRVIVKTFEQFRKIVAGVPAAWKKRNDLRCYLAFVREPVTAQEVAHETQPREGIDFIEIGEGVLYMSTLLSGLTKSGLSTLATKKIYQDISMRNYRTAQKILGLMERKEDV
jgi:uncharacterized protein (DUF1697 family)